MSSLWHDINPLHESSLEVKTAFGAWHTLYRLLHIRYVTFLTAILYLVYAQIHMQTVAQPTLESMLLVHKYLLPLTLFSISFLTLKPHLYKLILWLVALAPMGAAVANLWLTQGLDTVHYYVPELYLIVIWIFAISGLPFWYGLVSATSTAVIIVLFEWYVASEIRMNALHYLWLFSAYAFGVMTAWLLDKTSKGVFLQQQALEHYATRDMLTKLYNRYKTEELLQESIARAKRYFTPCSIILIDIDHFKEVNDTFGHAVGDQILQAFAKLIEEHVRDVDYVGRIGGEEFLVVLPQTTLDQAIKAAGNLQAKIRAHHFEPIGEKTASFGVAQYRQGDSKSDLLKRADDALYRAKHAGRNRIEVL